MTRLYLPKEEESKQYFKAVSLAVNVVSTKTIRSVLC